jgi:UDPglucose 6-dehydrogenase
VKLLRVGKRVIVTEWDEFKSLKPEDFLREMKKPVVIDGRRIFDPQIFTQKLLFKAVGLGQT